VELNGYCGPGTKVVIYSPTPTVDRTKFIESDMCRRKETLSNLTVHHMEGSLGARFLLEDLPIKTSSKILILSDNHASGAFGADSHTMAVIMQVRDILGIKCGDENSAASARPVIVPEIQEEYTEETCAHLGISDYINSVHLVARMLAVVAETPDMSSIINDIVSPDGTNFVIRNLDDYSMILDVDQVSFDMVVAVGALCDEVVVGWSRVEGTCADPWEINPKDRKACRPWTPDSRLVALRASKKAREDDA